MRRAISVAMGLAVIAVLAMVVVMGIAIAAKANADTNDDAYIGALDHFRVPYDNEVQAIALGHEACAVLDRTNDLRMGIADITVADEDMSINEASFLVGAAIYVYCPGHTNLVSGKEGV